MNEARDLLKPADVADLLHTMMNVKGDKPIASVTNVASGRFVQYCPDKNHILCILDLPQGELTKEEWQRGVDYFTSELNLQPATIPYRKNIKTLQMRSSDMSRLANITIDIFNKVFQLPLESAYHLEYHSTSGVTDGADMNRNYAAAVTQNAVFMLQSLTPQEKHVVHEALRTDADMYATSSIIKERVRVLSNILALEIVHHQDDFTPVFTLQEEAKWFKKLTLLLDGDGIRHKERIRICSALLFCILNSQALADEFVRSSPLR